MTNHNTNDPYNRHGNRHDNQHTDNGGKKALGLIVGALLIAGVAAGALYMVDLDQTKEARLPNVNVSVEEGQMPVYDVDVADINVEQKEMDVEVPTMDVQTETKTIEVEVPVDVDAGTTTETVTVPTLNVEKPKEDNPADNPTD